MSRTKKHEEGFELYKKSNGKISNAEIAKRLDTSDTTVRKWKSRYKWIEKLAGNQNVTSQSVTPNIRDRQYKKIKKLLLDAGVYSPALELLIEVYLDAYEEYEDLKEEGMAEEKNRKELARILGQIGIEGKNRDLIKPNIDSKKKEENQGNVSKENKLVKFRQRMTK